MHPLQGSTLVLGAIVARAVVGGPAAEAVGGEVPEYPQAVLDGDLTSRREASRYMGTEVERGPYDLRRRGLNF